MEATINQPYAALRIGDEFDAYLGGRRQKRCRIVKKVEEEGYVKFTLAPVTGSFAVKLAQVRFVANATAEVYRDRTPPPESTRGAALAQRKELVLQVLKPGKLYSARQIADLIKQQCQVSLIKMRVLEACKSLAEEGKLRDRKVNGIYHYRLDLPRDPGFPVVEFMGMGSQRLGWIVEWRHFIPTNSLQPVVRFLDGSQSFSNEDWLDPASPEQCKQIEVAKLRYEGKPVNRIEISPWLLYELKEAWQGKDRKAKDEAMVSVAKVLGLLPEDAIGFRGARCESAWNKVLEYLDVYYMGWEK